jgi:hypothetical protein
MWFTFEMDRVASKPDSIIWALARLEVRWYPLLQNALDDRLLGFNPTQMPATHLVEETLEFAALVTRAVR